MRKSLCVIFVTVRYMRAQVVAAIRCAIALVVVSIATNAMATQYIYDAQNRLKAVTDASGNTAEYRYDAVGNLLEVRRYSSSQLSISSFAPPAGPAGAAVTINGTGFDVVASGNQVAFNGAPAVVGQATATSLAVTVPALASSGTISVTAHGQTVQSTGDFVVTADSGAPTITGFTPACAPAGQTVTVTGTNFDVLPNATRVEVGERVTSSTVSSSTTLTFKAPQATVGGRVRVTTSKGSVESVDLLAVWPTGIVCNGTWIESHWASADGPATAISLDLSKSSLLYFHGQKGQWLSVQASNVVPTGSYVSVWLVLPDGTTVTTSPFRFGPTDGYTIDLPPLPATGTYAVRFQATSSTAVTASVVVESALMLTADAPATQVAIDAGRTRRFAFTTDGTSELSLGVDPVVLAPANGGAALSQIYAPDGSVIVGWGQTVLSCWDTTSPSGCHILMPHLGAGTYAVGFRANNANATTNATVWLSNDVAPTLQPGVPVQVATTRYGQTARLHFYGTAGSGVSIDLANLQLPQSGGTYVFVRDPDDIALNADQTTTQYVAAGGSMLTIPFLPKTGTYTVIVTPINGSATSMEATLDPGVPLIVDGPVKALSTNLRGKGIRLVVDMVAGQKIGVGITNVAVAGSTGYPGYSLYAPGGTKLSTGTCPPTTTPGCELDLGPARVAGRYAITIEPPTDANGMSLSAQATSDIVVAGTVGTRARSLAISRYGGNARVSLQGTPGAGRTITITDFVPTPVGKHMIVSVLLPDGRPLNATTPLYVALDQSSNTATLKIGDFPIEGTYDVFFDPRDAALASFKVQVGAGVDVIGPGGVSIHKDVVPGPWARAVFAGLVGDHKAVGMDITSLTNPTGTNVSLSVFDPDKWGMIQRETLSLLSTCPTSSSGCDFDLPDLTVSGNYQVLAELPVTKPDDAAVQISVNSDIVVQGSSGTFNLAARGQNGRLLFDAAAGHSPCIKTTRLSPTGADRLVDLTVYTPDGVKYTAGALYGTQTMSTLQLNIVPQTGQYMLLLDPANGYPTDLSVTVNLPCGP